MKNKIFFIIGIVFCMSCSHKPATSYEEEALLHRYLKEYQSNAIKHQDYALLTYRTYALCQGCCNISLDTILSKELKTKGNTELYVLFDKKDDLDKIKATYGNTIHYLTGDPNIMDKFGIPRVVPALFYFKDSKLVDWKQINRY